MGNVVKKRHKVLSVFGTRPEAIKMAPVILELAKYPDQFENRVCVTAQHREMLDQVLAVFNITPDVDLNLMKPNQDLFQITAGVLLEMKAVLEKEKPDVVLVHGDTTTTMATSLACYYLKIPVGHVEAGLRTFDKDYPFPEEINRVLTDSVADWHFAPTEQSKRNLMQLGVNPKGVHVTGNTVIDALHYTLNRPDRTVELPLELDPNQRMILVTAHRRENFGEPMVAICEAIKTIATEFKDVCFVIPVHLNPNVREVVFQQLGNVDRVHLIEPVDYEPFCHLMQASTLILTDSGGIQEEAPSLSKPVLVLRNETERPEAVAMGTVKLIGPNRDELIATTRQLLTDKAAYDAMAQAANPYGDGLAAPRIMEILSKGLEIYKI